MERRGSFPLFVLILIIGYVSKGVWCVHVHRGLGPPAVGLDGACQLRAAGSLDGAGARGVITLKDHWWEEEDYGVAVPLHGKTREEAGKALQAASCAVPRSIHPAPSSVPCNQCGLEMERRASRYGPFYGCKGVRLDLQSFLPFLG